MGAASAAKNLRHSSVKKLRNAGLFLLKIFTEHYYPWERRDPSIAWKIRGSRRSHELFMCDECYALNFHLANNKVRPDARNSTAQNQRAAQQLIGRDLAILMLSLQ